MGINLQPTPAESYQPQVAWALQERDSKGVDSDTKEGHLIVTPQGGSFNKDTMAFTQNGDGDVLTGNVSAALSTNGHASGRNSPKAQVGMAVRRLTPQECERLQGFKDDFTRIMHNGKPAADGPRYRALGNSMATPVIRWIGEQIQKVSK
jgi:DNA (cytosine-5)-methyltransferase 1